MRLFDKSLFLLTCLSVGIPGVQAVPRFVDIINSANAVFNSRNPRNATDLFIQGYWEFRNRFTEIWCGADLSHVKEQYVPGFNGQPFSIALGPIASSRGFTPQSNIWLGCWLQNKPFSQNEFWYSNSSNGWSNATVFPGNEMVVNNIRQVLLSDFGKKSSLAGFKDVGFWLQENFCVPVSHILLQHFQTMPADVHELLQILELYKCFVECDCGGSQQVKFSQANYYEVYNAFYPWFVNLINAQLNSPANTDFHTALTRIFVYWSINLSDFVDTGTFPRERLRSLGGYQIEIDKIMNMQEMRTILFQRHAFRCEGAKLLFNVLFSVHNMWNILVALGQGEK